MMGVTLLSVDAAELGDRALVDSLLPYSYRCASHRVHFSCCPKRRPIMPSTFSRAREAFCNR